jgi:hypothetical protein
VTEDAPPPAPDDHVSQPIPVQLTHYQAGRCARLLLREARVLRRRAGRSDFAPPEGKRDRNRSTASIYEKLGKQLLAALPPEQAEAIRQSATDEKDR